MEAQAISPGLFFYPTTGSSQLHEKLKILKFFLPIVKYDFDISFNMWKRLVLSGLIGGLLLNLFSTPIALMIYEINKQVQAYGSSHYQEVSLTVCETSCAIQERIVIEQHFSPEAERPVRISYNPLALYWEHQELPGFTSPEQQVNQLIPYQLGGQPTGYSPEILDPPKQA